MGFVITQDRIVFEGTKFVVVNVADLIPKHKNFPYGTNVVKPNGKRAVPKKWRYKKVDNRRIDILYCHQTAGAVSYDGLEAVLNTYRFMQAEPAYTALGKWTGRGRGWPSGCYTFYIPYHPLFHKGKIVIFQCWDLDWVTWHSSHNANSIAIVCQGYFRDESMRSFRSRKGCPTGKPSEHQVLALSRFYSEYAVPVIGIKKENILGHCDSPKPKVACPGTVIKKLYRGFHEDILPELVELPDVHHPIFSKLPGMLNLDSWKDRQAALVLLGHSIGKYGRLKNGVDGDPGYMTRMAIESEEDNAGLLVDGSWDDVIDYQIKLQLLARHKTQDDLNNLI